MSTMYSKMLVAGLAAVSVLALAAVPARAADKPGAGLKICISLDKVNASREGQLRLWKVAAQELGVARLIIQVANEDAQRQSSQVDTCIAQGVNGIVSIPWDYQAVLQDMARAKAAHIPFVTMDQAPADVSTVDYFVGSDPHADGLHLAQQLVKLVGDKPTKVADIQGALSQFNGMERDRGFKDGIKGHPNIKIVAEIPTDWHPAPALAGMQNALQANPDLGAVFSASDGMLPPVWSALQKVGRYAKAGAPNHVIVLSVDGDPQGCSAVKNGYMDAGAAQPFAEMTMDTLKVVIEMAKTGKGPTGDARVQRIPGVIYTPANIAKTASEVWGCAG